MNPTLPDVQAETAQRAWDAPPRIPTGAPTPQEFSDAMSIRACALRIPSVAPYSPGTAERARLHGTVAISGNKRVKLWSLAL